MDPAIICVFVELCVDCGLDVVENDYFFLTLSGLVTERGELLVAAVDEVIKVRPDLILVLGLVVLIRKQTAILIHIEIIVIDHQYLRIVLNLLQY
jgi:hypothetical protein